MQVSSSRKLRAHLAVVTAAAALCAGGGAASAQDGASTDGPADRPLHLMLQPEYESVYAPPAPQRPGEGVNEGGVRLDLSVSYLTDYVFRGFDRGEFIAAVEDPEDVDPDRPDFDPDAGREDAASVQTLGQVTWDLGKAPHPFVGVFVNTYDNDPESSFQEIRPFVGFELTLRPIIFSAGHTSYIHPDRDNLNTTEVWGRLELDDSYFYRTDEPLFSPYVMAAYDYDLYDGVYIEGGLEHVFEIEEWGVVLTAQASAAYVDGHALFDPATLVPDEAMDLSGFQHYQLGLIGAYELNPLLNIPLRYGRWTLTGYLYYTDGIDDELRADTQLWGGGGIGFSY